MELVSVDEVIDESEEVESVIGTGWAYSGQ